MGLRHGCRDTKDHAAFYGVPQLFSNPNKAFHQSFFLELPRCQELSGLREVGSQCKGCIAHGRLLLRQNLEFRILVPQLLLELLHLVKMLSRPVLPRQGRAIRLAKLSVDSRHLYGGALGSVSLRRARWFM